ncbi:hypothetical protein N3K66_003488 [Trichothecium roseum]|uniref:Uncharacterized protein n=1 Tax=Trichothecium roseum TaxID=47278 RepID=A0ACC0V6W8_9HYPO|nr:hypothetical protein N3K66_003488 [Trichothecium roseum]
MATEAVVASQRQAGSAAAQPAAIHRDSVHVGADGAEPGKTQDQQQPQFLHSPPDSNNTVKSDATDSELSDLDDDDVAFSSDAIQPPKSPKMDDQDSSHHVDESQPQADNVKDEEKPEQGQGQPQEQAQQEKEQEQEHKQGQGQEQEEDIGEVLPDHWSGAVPIFKPTPDQFKDFNRFMSKVNDYGMKSGIIKIIPPKEWLDKQPPLDDLVKHVRIREPIKQDIMGSNGTYRQVNFLHGRSYNVPSWRTLCEQSEHQPPARRGERRANAVKPKPQRAKPAAAPKPAASSAPRKRGRGRPRRARGGGRAQDERPMTPVSPKPDDGDEVRDTIENDPGVESDGGGEPTPSGRMGGGTRGGARGGKAKTQSTSARRKYSKREGSAAIDEAAFKDFDYRMDISDYTPERCEELERAYWKTLTYAPPLYGADMMGTLFDDRTETWNLTKLPNILDVLGTKVPGVNTAYLYFGMWKATFAWHLEDVDLYSINYLHFGAPKQWYSISQADARRFEQAMKGIWPADAKSCDQFLRHKAFLISPQHLLQNYGIRVNKVVSYPGEFVVTYPYGYHSGYNLGYNCAEAVNFALDSWLEMGKIAKKCECAQAQDSVWIDVHAIERKLRGEETEYEETDEDEDEEDEDEEEEDGTMGLPSPPGGQAVKFKAAGRKRKRGPGEKGPKPKVKKIKLRIKNKIDPPCCLCPNDIASMELLPTTDGRKAHRICALYLPETYIEAVDGKDTVHNISGVHKDRLDLKCLYCRSKRGGCFQCSQKKCARAYHPSCAAAAGVFVEDGEVPVFGEDGTEYKEQAFEFSCRFHRTRREKKMDGATLEDDARIRDNASLLKSGDICQLQYYRGDVFAGCVVENRLDEETIVVDVIPNGDRIEVEWKWLLVPDASDYHLPKASVKALPLPTSRKAKDKINAKRSSEDEKPRKGDEFVGNCVWAEFNLHEVDGNRAQAKVDFAKDDQIWHYLGRTSTEAKAQYTEDPRKRRHNPKGNYLDTLPKAPKPMSVKRVVHTPMALQGGYPYMGMHQPSAAQNLSRPDKPYVYKPKKPADPTAFDPSRMYTSQRFAPAPPSTESGQDNHQLHQQQHQQQQMYQSSNGHHYGRTNQQGSPGNYASQRFEVKQYQGPYNKVSSSFTPAPANPRWEGQTGKYNPPQTTFHHYSFPTSSEGRIRPPPPPPQQQQQQQQQPPYHAVVSRPAAKPMSHPSIYQKYPFFHVNHNRDPLKYQTPYSVYLGFINGYQGDLRAHLQANTHDLFQRSNTSSLPHAKQQMAAPMRPELYNSAYNLAVGPSANPVSTLTSGVDAILSAAAATTPTSQILHSAIGAPDASPLQRYMEQSNEAKRPAAKSSPKTRTAVAAPFATPVATDAAWPANKPKESPVPLPANFLRHTAMFSPKSKLGANSASPSVQSSTQKPTNLANAVTNVNASPVHTPSKAPPAREQSASQTAQSAEAGIPGPDAKPTQLPCVANTSSPQAPPASQICQPSSESDVKDKQSEIWKVASDDEEKTEIVSTLDEPFVQEFADVPGPGSVDLRERMVANLRRIAGSDRVA